MTTAYVRPALPTPDRYPDATGAVAAASAAIGWRRVFTAPPLRTLIEDALANNRDLRIAAGRVEAAQANARAQTAQRFPSLSALGLGARSGLPAGLSLTGRPTTSSLYLGALSASWETDFWGRLRSLSQSARESYLASEDARRAVASGLIREVAAGYLRELEYRERLELARRTIANREESLRIVRRRYEVGSGSKLPVTQAQTLLGQAQTERQALELARAQNTESLALLVGRPVKREDAPGGLALADFAAPLSAGLPSELLVNRPDVRAAEHRLRAAHADIAAARAAYFPDISLMASGGGASAQLDKLFGTGTGLWSFTPTVTVPIFNGGRLDGALAGARAERDIALAAYEQAIQSAFRDVADALAARRWLAEQIQSTEQTLEALTERARLADLSYANGRAAYLEVLEAQRDLFSAQEGLVQLRRAQLESEVDLYAALGGGLADGPGTNEAGSAT